MKKLSILMAVFAMSVLMVSMASALTTADVKFADVEVNDHNIDFGVADNQVSETLLAVEEGEEIEIIALLKAGTTQEDIQVEADIGGYEYDDYEELEDTTHNFEIQAGTTKAVKLKVKMPHKLDKKGYSLRLRILDANTASVEKTVRLSVEPKHKALDIKDVAFSPGNSIKAGRSLLATVLLENYGNYDLKDVKVTVSIPALGVQATEFVDDVKTERTSKTTNNFDYEDVPEMFLTVPANAAPGTYKVNVEVKYDDLRETVSKSYNVDVVENDLFKKDSGKLVLAVGPQTQNVAQGKTATYGVALTNAGSTSKAYAVEAMTSNGVATTVSESLAVLGPGQNKVVYVSVTPGADTPAGEQLVTVTVKSGTAQVESVALKANVVEGNASNFNLRNGLEIALIVLVVLLVIIGLVVGFSRLKRDDEEEQTYY